MKLQGIKVLDLSLFLPGPHLTMMMADHGAEVIKLEPPGGEPVREVGLKQAGHSVWFRNTHRGKRCIQLDLKSEVGRAAFLSLADEADVIVEAFRPGVVERLGVDYATISRRNPRVVYCSISAYGQTGPKRLKPAHDLAIEADAGVVGLNLGQDGQPAMPAMPAADMAGSLMALSGILMALLRRAQTGLGDYLDISMQDSLVAWLPNVVHIPFVEGRAPDVQQQRSWGGAAFYNLYQTRDGRWLALGGSEHKFAHNLLHALQRDDLAALCAQPPGVAQLPVVAYLRGVMAERTLAEWEQFLAPLDVCWAPVRRLDEGLADAHLRAREMVVTDADGGMHLGIPIKFTHEPGRIDPHLDQVGESTAAVLAGRASP